MSRIIAMVSQKGGTGKTATTINLGYELSQLGRRVLLVDFDPQANTTSGLGLNPRELTKTVYEALQEPDWTKNCIQNIVPNLDILPANLNLAGAELKLGMMGHADRTAWLTDALDPVASGYDYVMIDCPPSLGFYTVNAFYAADQVLIPLQCEYYAFDALPALFEVMRDIQKRKNRRGKPLEVAGIVLTMYDKRVALTGNIEELSREEYGDLVFETVIPRNIRISEAAIEGVSVGQYDKRSSGALAYQALVKEFVGRIEG